MLVECLNPECSVQFAASMIRCPGCGTSLRPETESGVQSESVTVKACGKSQILKNHLRFLPAILFSTFLLGFFLFAALHHFLTDSLGDARAKTVALYLAVSFAVVGSFLYYGWVISRLARMELSLANGTLTARGFLMWRGVVTREFQLDNIERVQLGDVRPIDHVTGKLSKLAGGSAFANLSKAALSGQFIIVEKSGKRFTLTSADRVFDPASLGKLLLELEILGVPIETKTG